MMIKPLLKKSLVSYLLKHSLRSQWWRGLFLTTRMINVLMKIVSFNYVDHSNISKYVPIRNIKNQTSNETPISNLITNENDNTSTLEKKTVRTCSSILFRIYNWNTFSPEWYFRESSFKNNAKYWYFESCW